MTLEWKAADPLLPESCEGAASIVILADRRHTVAQGCGVDGLLAKILHGNGLDSFCKEIITY